MSIKKEDPYEIRHKNLHLAVKIIGDRKILAKLIRANYSQLNNWMINKYMEIKYQYLMRISRVTGIDMEGLAPGDPDNKTMIILRDIKMLIKVILTNNSQCLREIEEDRRVIVGTDRVLVSGLARLEAYKTSGIEFIPVEVIDLAALYSKKQTIDRLGVRFLKSELGAIGLRLEQLMDLDSWCPGITVAGRKETYVAEILGFNSRDTYHRLKQVCLSGISELILLVDKGRMPIKVAAEISQSSPAQQLISIQLKQKAVNAG